MDSVSQILPPLQSHATIVRVVLLGHETNVSRDPPGTSVVTLYRGLAWYQVCKIWISCKLLGFQGCNLTTYWEILENTHLIGDPWCLTNDEYGVLLSKFFPGFWDSTKFQVYVAMYVTLISANFRFLIYWFH